MIERGRVWPEPADEDDAAIVMEAIAYLRRIEGLTGKQARDLDAIQVKVDRRRESRSGGDSQQYEPRRF